MKVIEIQKEYIKAHNNYISYKSYKQINQLEYKKVEFYGGKKRIFFDDNILKMLYAVNNNKYKLSLKHTLSHINIETYHDNYLDQLKPYDGLISHLLKNTNSDNFVEKIKKTNKFKKYWPNKNELKLLYMIEFNNKLYTTHKYTMEMTRFDKFKPYVYKGNCEIFDDIYGLCSQVKYKTIKSNNPYKFVNNIVDFKINFNNITKGIFQNILNMDKNNVFGNSMWAYVVGSSIIKALSIHQDRYKTTDIDIALYTTNKEIKFNSMVIQFFRKITNLKNIKKENDIEKQKEEYLDKNVYIILKKSEYKWIIWSKGIELEIFQIFKPIHYTVKNFHLPPAKVMFDFRNIYGYVSFYYSIYTSMIPWIYMNFIKSKKKTVKNILQNYYRYGFGYYCLEEDAKKYFL